MDRRAQTPSDYLIGISLLLVTIFGVFAFVPTVFDPFEQPVNPEEEVMADRLAEDLVHNHTVLSKQRTVDYDALDDTLTGDIVDERQAAGIPGWKQVNVTIRNETKRVATEGDDWRGDRPGGTSIRRIISPQPTCHRGCSLVVRVWNR